MKAVGQSQLVVIGVQDVATQAKWHTLTHSGCAGWDLQTTRLHWTTIVWGSIANACLAKRSIFGFQIIHPVRCCRTLAMKSAGPQPAQPFAEGQPTVPWFFYSKLLASTLHSLHPKKTKLKTLVPRRDHAIQMKRLHPATLLLPFPTSRHRISRNHTLSDSIRIKAGLKAEAVSRPFH